MNKQELYALLKNPSVIQSEHIPMLETLVGVYPYSASFVFLYLYGLAKTEDVRYSAELKRYVAYLPHREKLFELLNGQEQGQKKDAESIDGAVGFDLIDSFLDDARLSGEDLPTELYYEAQEGREYFAEESISVQPLLSLSPELQSKVQGAQSIDTISDSEPVETSELFTETLAKIYIKQGKYERALSIIKSLYLHYPQKSRYFAEQIAYLERLVNNNTEKNTE